MVIGENNFCESESSAKFLLGSRLADVLFRPTLFDDKPTTTWPIVNFLYDVSVPVVASLLTRQIFDPATRYTLQRAVSVLPNAARGFVPPRIRLGIFTINGT